MRADKGLDCDSAALEHRITAYLVWPYALVGVAAAAAERAAAAAAASAPGAAVPGSGRYSPTLDAMLRDAALRPRGGADAGAGASGGRRSRRSGADAAASATVPPGGGGIGRGRLPDAVAATVPAGARGEMSTCGTTSSVTTDTADSTDMERRGLLKKRGRSLRQVLRISASKSPEPRSVGR